MGGGGRGWEGADLKSRQEPLVLGEDFLVIKVSGERILLCDSWKYIPLLPPNKAATIPLASPLGCVSIADRAIFPRTLRVGAEEPKHVP